VKINNFSCHKMHGKYNVKFSSYLCTQHYPIGLVMDIDCVLSELQTVSLHII
jgi:hypothetical protein